MHLLKTALDLLGIWSPATLLRLTQGAANSSSSSSSVASPGCNGQQQPEFVGQTRMFDIQTGDDGTRQYSIHLPSGYKPDAPRPLLLAYHGRNGNPDEFERATRFSDEAVNSEMIAVYPAGIRNRWQGPSYANRGVSDKVFTTQLVRHLKASYCVDESRVYAAGFSNGGGFVGTLACSPEHGGQFAALAGFAAALYTDVAGDDRCRPARSPLPLLELHSLEDPVVPYAGGEGNGGPLPPLPEWLGRWAGRNGCGPGQTTELDGGGQHTTWSCRGMDGALQHYNTTKLGHFWPAADAEMDISPIIIDFFNGWTKPA